MPNLFEPLTQRSVTLRNRIGVSPMCTYMSEARDGLATSWHVAHVGARAIGGAGLVMTEATAVLPEGRITPNDLGIWSDAHADAMGRMAEAIRTAGAVPAIQLAHAGRKASTYRPWGTEGRGVVPEAEGGWPAFGPTDTPFREGDPAPQPLDETGLEQVIDAFATAARRAVEVGFEVIEVHAAHGYLLHSFLSPLVNTRSDAWGGDYAGRTRLLREVVRAVRETVPESLPVWVRVSATDAHPDGWAPEDTVDLSRDLATLGVDLVDCSSGGAAPGARLEPAPLHQVPFAEAVKAAGATASAAVGGITTAEEADAILREGRADVVLLGRAMLAEPAWALHAARRLGVQTPWQEAYGWALTD